MSMWDTFSSIASKAQELAEHARDTAAQLGQDVVNDLMEIGEEAGLVGDDTIVSTADKAEVNESKSVPFEKSLKTTVSQHHVHIEGNGMVEDDQEDEDEEILSVKSEDIDPENDHIEDPVDDVSTMLSQYENVMTNQRRSILELEKDLEESKRAQTNVIKNLASVQQQLDATLQSQKRVETELQGMLQETEEENNELREKQSQMNTDTHLLSQLQLELQQTHKDKILLQEQQSQTMKQDRKDKEEDRVAELMQELHSQYADFQQVKAENADLTESLSRERVHNKHITQDLAEELDRVGSEQVNFNRLLQTAVEQDQTPESLVISQLKDMLDIRQEEHVMFREQYAQEKKELEMQIVELSKQQKKSNVNCSNVSSPSHSTIHYNSNNNTNLSYSQDMSFSAEKDSIAALSDSLHELQTQQSELEQDQLKFVENGDTSLHLLETQKSMQEKLRLERDQQKRQMEAMGIMYLDLDRDYQKAKDSVETLQALLYAKDSDIQSLHVNVSHLESELSSVSGASDNHTQEITQQYELVQEEYNKIATTYHTHVQECNDRQEEISQQFNAYEQRDATLQELVQTREAKLDEQAQQIYTLEQEIVQLQTSLNASNANESPVIADLRAQLVEKEQELVHAKQIMSNDLSSDDLEQLRDTNEKQQVERVEILEEWKKWEQRAKQAKDKAKSQKAECDAYALIVENLKVKNSELEQALSSSGDLTMQNGGVPDSDSTRNIMQEYEALRTAHDTIVEDRQHMYDLMLQERSEREAEREMLQNSLEQINYLNEQISSNQRINVTTLDEVDLEQTDIVDSKLQAEYATVCQELTELKEDLHINYVSAKDVANNYRSIDDVCMNYVPMEELATKYVPIEDVNTQYIPIEDIIKNYISIEDVAHKYMPVDIVEKEYITLNLYTSIQEELQATQAELQILQTSFITLNNKYNDILESSTNTEEHTHEMLATLQDEKTNLASICEKQKEKLIQLHQQYTELLSNYDIERTASMQLQDKLDSMEESTHDILQSKQAVLEKLEKKISKYAGVVEDQEAKVHACDADKVRLVQLEGTISDMTDDFEQTLVQARADWDATYIIPLHAHIDSVTSTLEQKEQELQDILQDQIHLESNYSNLQQRYTELEQEHTKYVSEAYIMEQKLNEQEYQRKQLEEVKNKYTATASQLDRVDSELVGERDQRCELQGQVSKLHLQNEELVLKLELLEQQAHQSVDAQQMYEQYTLEVETLHDRIKDLELEAGEKDKLSVEKEETAHEMSDKIRHMEGVIHNLQQQHQSVFESMTKAHEKALEDVKTHYIHLISNLQREQLERSNAQQQSSNSTSVETEGYVAVKIALQKREAEVERQIEQVHKLQEQQYQPTLYEDSNQEDTDMNVWNKSVRPDQVNLAMVGPLLEVYLGRKDVLALETLMNILQFSDTQKQRVRTASKSITEKARSSVSNAWGWFGNQTESVGTLFEQYLVKETNKSMMDVSEVPVSIASSPIHKHVELPLPVHSNTTNNNNTNTHDTTTNTLNNNVNTVKYDTLLPEEGMMDLPINMTVDLNDFK